jgi:hypothetical protein
MGDASLLSKGSPRAVPAHLIIDQIIPDPTRRDIVMYPKAGDLP